MKERVVCWDLSQLLLFTVSQVTCIGPRELFFQKVPLSLAFLLLCSKDQSQDHIRLMTVGALSL